MSRNVATIVINLLSFTMGEASCYIIRQLRCHPPILLWINYNEELRPAVGAAPTAQAHQTRGACNLRSDDSICQGNTNRSL